MSATQTQDHTQKRVPATHLKRVELQLARSAQFPDGSARRGYIMLMPIDGSGHLDAAFWRDHQSDCRVRRFWEGLPDRKGMLVHRSTTNAGADWLIDYDKHGHDDDQLGQRLGQHKIALGEYVTFRDAAQDLTFQIVSLRAAKPGDHP